MYDTVQIFSGLKVNGFNTLDPKEATSSTSHSRHQEQRWKEVTMKNQDIAKGTVVYGQHLKFTGGNEIESKSSILKDET